MPEPGGSELHLDSGSRRVGRPMVNRPSTSSTEKLVVSVKKALGSIRVGERPCPPTQRSKVGVDRLVFRCEVHLRELSP